ncbi:hypothetical protein F4809DRAFT_664479 [Biscogniauxia mediterranea]|nr:hypothetical protein F4809DRAFT_664479 [Biscogniauxia mediterranea]
MRSFESMPSLTDLSTELLAQIVELVHATSPSSTPALSHTCSRLRPLAQHTEHRTVLTTTTPSLCALLPAMTELADLVVPRALLDALAALPRPVRLHARVANTGYSPPDAHEEEDNVYTLRGCASLHALDVEVEYTRAATCLRIMPPLKQVLLSCANLRVLRLDVRMPSGGCVVYAAPAAHCGLGFAAGGRPPALEELALEAYPFGREEEDRTAGVEGAEEDNDVDDSLVYEENTLGYPLPGCETDFWATTFDWSRLRRLRTRLPSLALRMAPYLTALREVEFSSASDYAVQETRAWCRRSLHIHQDETRLPRRPPPRGGAPPSPSPPRSTPSGAAAVRGCARSRSRSTWRGRSAALLERAVASARAIVPRGCVRWRSSSSSGPRPYVTYAAVAGLLGRFRRHKLRKLVVVSGVAAAAPEDLGFGLPAPTAFWPEHNSTAFERVLRRVVEDGEEDALRLLGGGGEKELPEAFKVALEGPTPVSEWDERY